MKNLFLTLIVLLLSLTCLTVAQTKTFEPTEATIADIHRALRTGKFTCIGDHQTGFHRSGINLSLVK